MVVLRIGQEALESAIAMKRMLGELRQDLSGMLVARCRADETAGV